MLAFATLTHKRTMADREPTVRLVCAAADTCIALDAIPLTGMVELSVLGALPRGFGIHALAVRVGVASAVVSVTQLRVVGRGFSPTLVGPDIIDVSGDDRDRALEVFDDTVLVGGPAGYRCSGVALDAVHVLTAAHCAPATHIGLGVHADSATRVEVVRSDLHPVADAAVLTLATPLAVQVHSRRSALDASPPQGRLRILGYGVRDPLRFTGFGSRRQLDLNVDGWGCPRLRAAALGCRPGFELHIRDGSGNDTCFGDSGGPVFEATRTGWRLIAITSRGAQPRKVLCGEGGIYTRIDQLAPWLREVTSP